MGFKLMCYMVIILSFLHAQVHGSKDVGKSKKFVLITVLHNEHVGERVEEYITCLKRNLNHKMIEKIHVIYDSSNDKKTEEHPLLDYLQRLEIELAYVDVRPTFDSLFSIANTVYPYKKVIISNADIYFNQTLNVLIN